MAASTVEEDVANLKQLAEAGSAGVPSGGKYFLVWAAAIAFGLGVTYAVVAGALPMGEAALNYCWAAVLATGWIASMLMGRSDAAKPECVRLANRITTATWIATGAGLTAVWLGLAVSGVMTQAVMMPVAGAASGVATVVAASVFRLRWLYGVAVAWWVVAFVSFFLMDRIEFILFSAAAILVLQGGTGLALLIQERRHRR